jgi:nicotinate phosphoribosyltransferase
MAASYLRRGMNSQATFSLFVRHLPATRGFLVAAGLEDCLDFLEGLRFDDLDLAYLRDGLGFDADAISAFRDLRFTGDVWAVAEGRILTAGEPVLEVTAPIAEGQLVETYLLNTITFQTTVASKAARCVIAAHGRDLVDFAFRRTHGIEAAIEVARCSAMVGFAATSNVEAARRFGLRAAGTMAHSYVEAFPTEIDAFRAFAHDFPDRTTFLVDTYDTLTGVRRAIDVIRELDLDREGAALGVRIDSGNLALTASACRRLLDDEGLPNVRIFVSGGLDEHDIGDLLRDEAPIDAFGVGTRMGVSADAPSLDSVYKLVDYGGRPVIKLSAAKMTAPGAKQVFRPLPAGAAGDTIGLRDETTPTGTETLLRPVMLHGRKVNAPDPLEVIKGRFEADLAALPAGARDLREPVPVRVLTSERLARLTERVRREIGAGTAPAEPG